MPHARTSVGLFQERFGARARLHARATTSPRQSPSRPSHPELLAVLPRRLLRTAQSMQPRAPLRAFRSTETHRQTRGKDTMTETSSGRSESTPDPPPPAETRDAYVQQPGQPQVSSASQSRRNSTAPMLLSVLVALVWVVAAIASARSVGAIDAASPAAPAQKANETRPANHDDDSDTGLADRPLAGWRIPAHSLDKLQWSALSPRNHAEHPRRRASRPSVEFPEHLALLMWRLQHEGRRLIAGQR
jgi:hypothetical protein